MTISRTRSRLAAMRGQPTPMMVSRYLARWCCGRWLAQPAGPASRSFLGPASLLLSLRLLEAEVLGGVSAIQLEVASLLVGLRAPLALDTVLGAALAWHRCFELGSWVGSGWRHDASRHGSCGHVRRRAGLYHPGREPPFPCQGTSHERLQRSHCVPGAAHPQDRCCCAPRSAVQ